MQVTEKKLENSSIELQIELPETRVEVEYQNVFNEIQKKAVVDGFRKGKAPLSIIEKKFREHADSDVVENLLKSAYIEAVEEKKIRPINNPVFDKVKFKRGEPLSFTVVFEVPPTVQMAEYKNLPVEERSATIRDKDIEKELEVLQEKNANITKKGDQEPVQNGDLVKFKLKRIDNIGADEIEKLEFREYTIVAGKSKDEYTLDKDLLGMKEKEEKRVEVKYPKKYEVEDLAGKTVVYLVRIEEVSTRILPEIDDEFAKDLGEYENLDALKKEIEKNLEEYVLKKAQAEAKNRLLKSIVDASSFDLPRSVIDSEVQMLFRNFQMRYGFYAESVDEFIAQSGLEGAQFKKNLEDEAVKNIQSTLILSEIVKKENIQLDEERYRQTIERMAQSYNKGVDEIEKLLEVNETRHRIVHDVRCEQALDFIYANAAIKRPKPVSFEEFIKE